ncbi:hypothetical protein L836_1267 [Mycobacteroides abscessus MAB_110811_2726]|nr:hypothetical protein L836_1267 [Mycobacteroides abscessus MAB_110811_2726]
MAGPTHCTSSTKAIIAATIRAPSHDAPCRVLAPVAIIARHLSEGFPPGCSSPVDGNTGSP